MLALRCLQAALAIDAGAPKVHEQTIAFRSLLNTASELPPKVAEVLKAEFQAIAPSADLNKLNEEYLAKHKSSPLHVLSAIRTRRSLGADQPQCEKELTGILNMPEARFEDALEVSETLKSWRSGQAGAFRNSAKGRWPEVTRLT